jgi:hypothetical protein
VPQIVPALVAGRAAIGTAAYVGPKLTARLFGLNPNANPQAPFLGRLFGVRDFALAAGLGTSSASERAQWLRMGILCDLGDAVAAILAGRSGELSKLATALATATALAGAGAGITALLSERQGA